MQKILNRCFIICTFIFVVGVARAECTMNQYAVGDNCYSCPVNASCDGVNFICDDGYYNNNGVCTYCEAGYYCTGGQKHDCGNAYFCTGGTHRQSCLDIINYDTGADEVQFNHTESASDPHDNIHASRATLCFCDFYFHDDARKKYKYQKACNRSNLNGFLQLSWYDWCNTGYYPVNFLGLSGNGYYSTCAACDNKPEHAHYTDHGIPENMGDEISNCPWECDDGYGRTIDDTCELLCPTDIKLRADGGISINIYARRLSDPSLNILYQDVLCYVRMVPGKKVGTLNTEFNGVEYHFSN